VFKKLKVRICDMGMDLTTVFETEKLILNRISWKLNLSTPFEIHTIILKHFFPLNEDFEQIQETTNDWVNFSLAEWDLYRRFSQFSITISCILIALKSKEMYTEFENIKSFIQENYCISEIQECMSEIVKVMYTDEECAPENEHTQVKVLTTNNISDESSFECELSLCTTRENSYKTTKSENISPNIITAPNSFEEPKNLLLKKKRKSLHVKDNKITQFIKTNKTKLPLQHRNIRKQRKISEFLYCKKNTIHENKKLQFL
jgi:hypothetical protein